MNNEELKKKIKEVLRKRMTEFLGICKTDEISLDEEGKEAVLFYADEFADALIAAGIGDVIEAEMAANRYEMLYSMQARDMALAERKAFTYAAEIEHLNNKLNEAERRAARAERALKSALNDDTCYFCNMNAPCKVGRDWGSSECIQSLLQKAEKELAEERKDD